MRVRRPRLGDGALGGDVTVQALEMTRLFDGVVEGHDHLLPGAQVRARRQVFRQSFARHRHAAAVDVALLEQIRVEGSVDVVWFNTHAPYVHFQSER